ncbi:MAG: hypothetical protein ACI3XQ_02385 [Eubacteriales bacterium]
MKKIYHSPVMQSLLFACEDVLSASQGADAGINDLPIIWDIDI